MVQWKAKAFVLSARDTLESTPVPGAGDELSVRTLDPACSRPRFNLECRGGGGEQALSGLFLQSENPRSRGRMFPGPQTLFLCPLTPFPRAILTTILTFNTYIRFLRGSFYFYRGGYLICQHHLLNASFSSLVPSSFFLLAGDQSRDLQHAHTAHALPATSTHSPIGWHFYFWLRGRWCGFRVLMESHVEIESPL